MLYVQSNSNETACPNGTDQTVNCRLLSEYATDPYLSLDFNTTFVFLPGEHVLNTGVNLISLVHGVHVLKLRSAIDRNAAVMCNRGAGVSLQRLRCVEVSSLNFSSCEFFWHILEMWCLDTVDLQILLHSCLFQFCFSLEDHLQLNTVALKTIKFQ